MQLRYRPTQQILKEIILFYQQNPTLFIGTQYKQSTVLEAFQADMMEKFQEVATDNAKEFQYDYSEPGQCMQIVFYDYLWENCAVAKKYSNKIEFAKVVKETFDSNSQTFLLDAKDIKEIQECRTAFNILYNQINGPHKLFETYYQKNQLNCAEPLKKLLDEYKQALDMFANSQSTDGLLHFYNKYPKLQLFWKKHYQRLEKAVLQEKNGQFQKAFLEKNSANLIKALTEFHQSPENGMNEFIKLAGVLTTLNKTQVPEVYQATFYTMLFGILPDQLHTLFSDNKAESNVATETQKRHSEDTSHNSMTDSPKRGRR